MNSDKYNREIALHCPGCGGTKFECEEAVDSDEQTVKCAQCGRETIKRILMEENAENINTHIKEIGDEAVKDLSKKLAKTLKKLFK